MDFSEQMIWTARRNREGEYPSFVVEDVKNILNISGSFDLIYTERTLINLQTWEEQRQAIVDIGALLKPGGLYLMCECFKGGLLDINKLRTAIDLPPISSPWHNRYLDENQVLSSLCSIPGLILEDRVDYSANYYFLSRVVQAYAAAQSGAEIDYNSPINQLALHLPSTVVNIRGQGQMWVWRKV